MERHVTLPPIAGSQKRNSDFCWKEMLHRAFSGWESTEQTLERIFDRLEQTS